MPNGRACFGGASLARTPAQCHLRRPIPTPLCAPPSALIGLSNSALFGWSYRDLVGRWSIAISPNFTALFPLSQRWPPSYAFPVGQLSARWHAGTYLRAAL